MGNLILAALRQIRDGIQWLVDGLFALTTERAGFRWFVVVLSALGIYAASVLLVTPPAEIRDGFNLFMSGQTPPRDFLLFFVSIFINADLLRIAVVVILPFWVARRIAGIYLADIFEQEMKVGRDFIWRAAFATQLHTIHVRNGQIAEEDQDSPVVRIGGPGMVQVELDSAILTEKADGSYRIIGPTHYPAQASFIERLRASFRKIAPAEKYGATYEVLEDFERIRQCIDLRDQPQRADGKGLEFTARTRDGLLVTAKDVKFVFSIRRKLNLKDPDDVNVTIPPDLPYHYAPSAIRKQVYDQTRTVFKDKEPDRTPDWKKKPLPAPINGMVGTRMGGLIGERGLGEFLAFIGDPELDRLRTRWEEVNNASQAVAGIRQDPNGNIPSPPQYIPRDRFTRLFDEQAEFSSAAEARGIELRWIGVGTWDTPQPSISEKHREAWQISRENVRLSSPDYLNERYNQARQTELLRLINEMPLEAFYDFPDKERLMGRLVTKLLQDYLIRLQQGRQECLRTGRAVPPTLQNAIDIVDLVIQNQGNNVFFMGVS